MDGNGRWIVINAANGIELEQGRVTESSTEGMITMAMQIVAADALDVSVTADKVSVFGGSYFNGLFALPSNIAWSAPPQAP